MVDSMIFYTVMEDKVGSSESIMVTPDRFLTHEGMIFTVPKALYSVLPDSTILFADNEITSLRNSNLLIRRWRYQFLRQFLRQRVTSPTTVI